MLEVTDVTTTLDADPLAVEAALKQVDQAAVLDEVKTTLTWEVWDRKAPINGVPAEEVLKRNDIPVGGEVYLLKEGDSVVYFQPHLPEADGLQPIPAKDVQTIAEAHLKQVAQAAADALTMQRVSELLKLRR